MSNPLDELRSITSPVGADPELIQRVRSDLMNTMQHSKPHTPARSSLPRRRWVGVIAAAAILTATTAAWAITRDSSNTTAVQCPTGIMDAVTGDPVADCSNEWRRLTGDAEIPAMIGYDNGNGGVAVLLADEDAPSTYLQLPPGPFQNATLIELQASLADYGSGLASDCYDEGAARKLVQGELDRLGLSHWTITVDPDRSPDGEDLCAYFISEPTNTQVQLVGFSSETELDPYLGYAVALEQGLQTDCLALDAAADLARSLAADTAIVVDQIVIDFTEEAGVLAINTIDDPTASCTRSDVNVGGRVDVTLRGPSS